jgi:hypothetical protein
MVNAFDGGAPKAAAGVQSRCNGVRCSVFQTAQPALVLRVQSCLCPLGGASVPVVDPAAGGCGLKGCICIAWRSFHDNTKTGQWLWQCDQRKDGRDRLLRSVPLFGCGVRQADQDSAAECPLCLCFIVPSQRHRDNPSMQDPHQSPPERCWTSDSKRLRYSAGRGSRL